MSRIIKYRAWITKGKESEMVELPFAKLGYYDFEGSYAMAFAVDGYEDFSAHEKYTHIKFSSVIMQYTGLKDKNGKEIFEGDVLAWDNDKIDFPSGDGERMKVEWHGELSRFGLSFYSNHGGEGYTGTVQNIHEYVKRGAYVIGNIYENPDLIT